MIKIRRGHVLAALSDSFAIVTASRVLTALATGAFWATSAVVAATVAGPGASTRTLAVMSGALSLAVVAGVPLGTVAGQLTGWRGPFWMLAGLSLLAIGAVLRFAPAGFLGAYSYISPLLTDRAGIPAGLVPLVLVGFGIGALAGTAFGGRLGDRHPLSTVAGAVTLTASSLVLLALTSTHSTIDLVGPRRARHARSGPPARLHHNERK